jgi:predicted PurR-regulated permease PerM
VNARPSHVASEEARLAPPLAPVREDTPDIIPSRDPIDVRNAAITVLAVSAVIMVLQYAQAVIIPIVLGALISYVLEPAVAWLTEWRVPRHIAAAVVLAAVVGATGSLLWGLRSEGAAIVGQLPQAARRLRETMEHGPSRTQNPIEQMQKAATELEKAASAAAPPPSEPTGVQRVQVESPAFNVSQYLVWGSMSVATAIGQVVLILFFVYFVLASGDLYRRKLVKISPSITRKKITLQILAEIDRQIEMFLVVQILTSTIVAVATWLAFRYLGLEQAGVWGVAAGVFNSIPYFGPVIVTAGTAVVGFLQFGNVRMALIVSGVSLVITSLEGFLLTPWLTSRAARMNAVAIFVGLLFWGWVWNVWGMLLAVPMLVTFKAICDHVEDLKNIGELLGD